MPVGVRFSAPVQTGPGAHLVSCTMGTRCFPGVKSGWGVTLTRHPLLVPWSWKGRAIPFVVRTACTEPQCLYKGALYLFYLLNTVWHKKNGNFWKTQQKLKKCKKKIIDRNWTIKTCLLRDSNPNYQCLKITSCRWRPPQRMHSFTATTHFKSSRSFVSPCVCCMLYRMRLCRILQSMQHTQGDTKERELLKCVVAVK